MKKIKKILPFTLAIAMLLLVAACNGTEPDQAPAEEESQDVDQPAVILPAPVDPEEDTTETDNAQSGGYVGIQTLPADLDESIEREISMDLITIDDTNVEYEEWPPVIVDGVGVQGSSHQIIGDDVFPNYVSLVRVARALGSQVGIDGNEIVLNGLNGRISFEIGSTNFRVGNAIVALRQPAMVIDDVLYVPVEFFREVFGASESFFAGGEVHINSEGGDMH